MNHVAGPPGGDDGRVAETNDAVLLPLGAHGREALAIAVVLARRPYELTPTSVLVRLVGTPPARLRRVLAALGRAGLTEAASGRRGGHRLRRAPAQVSMLDVIEAAGGDLRAADCLLGAGACDGTCSVHPAWSAAQEALRGTLAATPLARVATG
jgi:Rrf2 family protein